MTLAPGTRHGAYEVTALIGAGGMGEVSRARDVKLDPDVAIKILPEAFTANPDRIIRFQREAKTLEATFGLAARQFGQAKRMAWEVFYLEGEMNARRVMSVSVEATMGAIAASPPKLLFQAGRMQANAADRYAVSKDGQRFLLRQLTPESLETARNPIIVTVNWMSAVESR